MFIHINLYLLISKELSYEDTFDVKLSNESHVIQDIRPVDSEINIVGILDKKIIYAMQEMVDAEMNHKQYMQDKKITGELIMQY
jgi:hypothetical protein